MNQPTYDVYVSNFPVEDEAAEDWWALRYRRLTKWQLRTALRLLYGQGWDTLSILIERNPDLEIVR
jgi:hypothetical protein